MENVIQNNLKFMLEVMMYLRKGEKFLIIANDRARSRCISETIMDLAISMGVETVMATMTVRKNFGDEPPKAIATAMKEVDVVLEVSENFDITHTDARMQASAMGKRVYLMWTDMAEDYLRNPISLKDLEEIEERDKAVAKAMDDAERLQITSPYGTDLTCSIKGRTARRLWARMPMAALPDYGEVPVIPLEGTTNGVVVTDAGVQGWGYALKKPIRVEVKKGRALIETVSSEVKEEAERFKSTLRLDENANNCAAEVAIGTSHLVPRVLTGAVRDYAILGYVHIAFGRNLDLGGQTSSAVHQDVLLTEASIKLDDHYILKDGILKV